MTTFDQPDPLAALLQRPQPAPVIHSVGRVRINGADYVVIKFDLPTGATVVFYDLPAAKGLADTIRGAATGLSLVQQHLPL